MFADIVLHNLGPRSSAGHAKPPYERSSSYKVLPLENAPTQTFTGLYAVFPTNSYVAIQVHGNYQIDWGDGTIETYWGGSVASHFYIYDSLPESSLDYRGFKQVIITITPQANQNLTSININIKHNSATGPAAFMTGWIDIDVLAPYLTTLTIGGSWSAIQHRLLEQFTLRASSLNNFSYFFNNCISLRKIVSLNTSQVVTQFQGMFQNCHELDVFPDLDLSQAINLRYLFYNCLSLKTFPALNTSQCENFEYMFYNNSSLEVLPALDTGKGTNFQYMLANCHNLKTVTSLDLNRATNVREMFQNCMLLKTATLLELKKSIDLSSAKFSVLELAHIFSNLGIGKKSVINISNSWGSALLTDAQRSIALNKNWTITG